MHIKKAEALCLGFFGAPVFEVVRVCDEPCAVEEQDAHKAEQHHAHQHGQHPVALQNEAARRTGQQGGNGQADEDGRGKLPGAHPRVGRRVGDDAVGQPRRDEGQNRVEPRILAAAHTVQQLDRLGVVGHQAADDRG